MSTPVKPVDTRAAINRIRFAYPLPKGVELDSLAGLWATALKGVTLDELDSAVDAFIRDGGKFFPKPAEIRRLAVASRKPNEPGAIPMDLHSRYLRWENDHGDEGCPVCGAKLKEITPESRGVPALEWDEKAQKLLEVDSPLGGARAGVLHNLEKHQKAKIPAIGYWTEPDVGPATRVGWSPDRRLTENLR